MNNCATTDRLMTTQEVAEYLGLSLETIYRFTTKRSIPFLKIGHSLRFKQSDVEEYLKTAYVATII